MGYGFVIDHRKCIGCHACTVACKSENDVPLGSFRTWVKYTEKGAYPEVKRHFTVLRCNHCDAAPCVEICPVNALHKRPDAIVDLDRDLCIGCRACMQACPYDALYLNAHTGTAEKCHYCAHRTEVGLEPACVVVCPEQAIVAGDADDPETEIGSLIRDEETSQRRLEKGTKPRVWYVDALEESLEPGLAREPDQWMWADRQRPPTPMPDFEPPADLLTSLNVDHEPVWGWHVWTYLVTKNVSAGAMLLAPFLALGGFAQGFAVDYVPEIVALVFWAITNFLLVHDLGRPERFIKILTNPNPRSWLVRGAWILGAFGLVIVGSIGARMAGADGLAQALRWVGVPLALLTAGYSAWLFGQCKGRDLWLENGLFIQLVLRASLMAAGLGMLLPKAAAGPAIPCSYAFIWLAVLCALGMVWELKRPQKGEVGKRSEAILRGSFRAQQGITLMLVAAVLVQMGELVTVTSNDILGQSLAFIISVCALFSYERAWIKAGQAAPIS